MVVRLECAMAHTAVDWRDPVDVRSVRRLVLKCGQDIKNSQEQGWSRVQTTEHPQQP